MFMHEYFNMITGSFNNITENLYTIIVFTY